MSSLSRFATLMYSLTQTKNAFPIPSAIVMYSLTLKHTVEIVAYDIVMCIDEGQMTEEEIAEAIEYEIAIRKHEYERYLDHMENVHGRNWRELEAKSERNFRKSVGLELG